MNIDKKKCNAWCGMFLNFINMTNELNKNEKRYIFASITIAMEKLKIEELLENTGGKDV